jgi:hypothetical protein
MQLCLATIGYFAGEKALGFRMVGHPVSYVYVLQSTILATYMIPDIPSIL